MVRDRDAAFAQARDARRRRAIRHLGGGEQDAGAREREQVGELPLPAARGEAETDEAAALAGLIGDVEGRSVRQPDRDALPRLEPQGEEGPGQAVGGGVVAGPVEHPAVDDEGRVPRPLAGQPAHTVGEGERKRHARPRIAGGAPRAGSSSALRPPRALGATRGREWLITERTVS